MTQGFRNFATVGRHKGTVSGAQAWRAMMRIKDDGTVNWNGGHFAAVVVLGGLAVLAAALGLQGAL